MNHMKIKKLNWDSDFFERIIGEVFFLDSNIAIENLDFDLIVSKQNKSFDVEIPGFEKTFEETKVIFEKTLSPINQNNDLEIKDTDQEQRTSDFFKTLAYESGKNSRFLLDQNFGVEKFKKLYDEWVANSLNKKFAIKTFYIEAGNTPVAFVTVQKAELIGKIGLIATNPAFQGKGYGKKILIFAEDFCYQNGMKTMEIPTQKQNVQACNFYEKMGYKIKEEHIIKHFWKKNDAIQ